MQRCWPLHRVQQCLHHRIPALPNVWAGKYAAKVEGSPDMPTGHRTNFSQRSQKSMEDFMGAVADYSGDREIAHFLKMNEVLFNAPSLVYLTTKIAR